MNQLLAQTADTVSAVDLEDVFDNVRFLDIRLINVADTLDLLVRFLFNALVIFLIVWMIYNKKSKTKEFSFSFLAIGATVFLLSFLLNNVKLQLGFALGLFAIFGIIRYRTDTIPIKEMTYLFVVIAISVINALANKKVSYAELLITNAAIVVGLMFLERFLMPRHLGSLRMRYEKIELIHRSDREQLLNDIRERTGIKVTHFDIDKIDYLRDTADLILYYDEADADWAPSKEK